MSSVTTVETDSVPSVTPTARVSVVTPIRNEEAHIEQTLTQLLEQEKSGIDVEILVVDGRSTDRTREIVSLTSRSAQRFRTEIGRRLSGDDGHRSVR